mmetsp:Transcript_2975/g.8899  ORF Transcript_2975/g.8899 Transcript_2975/m.8899 type:complete len:644 (+) Transcript_2975:27-1958(+)
MAASASAELIEFLNQVELAQFAEDIVDATGLRHLQDLLDTVVNEDDLSDLKDTCMKKLQIRKFYIRLLERQQRSKMKDSNDQARRSEMASESFNISKTADGPHCASSVPAAVERKNSASSYSSSSTSANGEGFLFVREVRQELRKLRVPEVREDVDYRDATGPSEIDYVEIIKQAMHSDALLPSDVFLPGCSRTLQPGLVLYEVKLQMAEPQMGKSAAQLWRRRDELPSNQNVNLAIVAGSGDSYDARKDLAKYSKRYPGIMFFIKKSSNNLGSAGTGVDAVAAEAPSPELPKPPGLCPRSRSPSQGRKSRQDYLAAVQQEDASDERGRDTHVESDSAQAQDAGLGDRWDESAKPEDELSRMSQSDCSTERSRSPSGLPDLPKLAAQWVGTGASDATSRAECAGPASASETRHGKPEPDKSSPLGTGDDQDLMYTAQSAPEGAGDNASKHEPFPEGQPSVVNEGVAAPDPSSAVQMPYRTALTSPVPPSLTTRGFAEDGRGPGARGGRAGRRQPCPRAGSPRREGLEPYIQRHGLTRQVAQELRCLPPQQQQGVMVQPLVHAICPSAVVRDIIGRMSSGGLHTSQEVEDFIARYALDLRAALKLRRLAPDLQQQALKAGLDHARNPSAALTTMCETLESAPRP